MSVSNSITEALDNSIHVDNVKNFMHVDNEESGESHFNVIYNLTLVHSTTSELIKNRAYKEDGEMTHKVTYFPWNGKIKMVLPCRIC